MKSLTVGRRIRAEKKTAYACRRALMGELATNSEVSTMDDQCQRALAMEIAAIAISIAAEAIGAAEEASRRLGRGLYGICDDCCQQISPKRLRYVPSARRCLTCQEEVEELARQ